MDGLITLLLIVFAVSKFFGKKKSKVQKVTKRFGNIEKSLEEMFGMESSNSAASSAATPPAAERRTSPARRPAAEVSMEQPVRSTSMEGRSVQSSFRSQLGSFSTEGHSGYGTGRPGSLTVESTEGMDYCDPTLGHDDHSTGCDVHAAMDVLDQFDNAESASLNLDWNRESLVRAVVMNEILTRPSQRMIRRG